MAIVRNIEIIAQSPNGFDDACREAIREASKTLRGISSFWIKNAEVVVENDQITMFRVNGKISFLVSPSISFLRWRVDGLKLGVMHRSRVISGMGSSGDTGQRDRDLGGRD